MALINLIDCYMLIRQWVTNGTRNISAVLVVAKSYKVPSSHKMGSLSVRKISMK
jgi:hypothetical protein